MEGACFGEGTDYHWLGQAGAVSCGFHSPSRAARVEFSGLNIPSAVPQQCCAGEQRSWERIKSLCFMELLTPSLKPVLLWEDHSLQGKKLS